MTRRLASLAIMCLAACAQQPPVVEGAAGTAASSCNSTPLSNALHSAHRLAGYIRLRNASAVITMVHPEVFGNSFTKAEALRLLTAAYADLLTQDIKLIFPSEVSRDGNHYFVFLPYWLENQDSSLKKYYKFQVLLLLSDDHGCQWSFAPDVGWTAERVTRYLPGYRGVPPIPDGIPLSQYRDAWMP